MPAKGYVQTPEHRAKISAGLTGRTPTDATRAKISATLKGRKLPESHRAAISASLIGHTRGWKGDQVGYSGAHHRARAAVAGKACVHCGGADRINAALRHDGSPSKRRTTVRRNHLMAYSISTEDYMPLCRGCHRVYDGFA